MIATPAAPEHCVEEFPAGQGKKSSDYCTPGNRPVTSAGSLLEPVLTVSRFFDALFAGAHGPNHLIAICDEQSGCERCFTTPFEAAVFAVAAGADGGVHAGAGLRQSGPPTGIGGKASVSDITFLRMVLNTRNYVAGQEMSWFWRLYEAVQFLKTCPLAPSMVVRSEHEVYAYWLFDKPWRLRTSSHRAAASEFLHRWESTTRSYAKERGWQVNPVWDLTDLIRIPGTSSRSTNSPEEVQILSPGKAGVPVRYSREYIQRRFLDASLSPLRTFEPPLQLPQATRDRLVLAHQASDRGLFATLWNGQWSGEYLSADSAACGLCRMLAFWLGPNPPLVAAAFRASGLYHPKWDSRIGTTDETRGEGMIREAIARQKESYGVPQGGAR